MTSIFGHILVVEDEYLIAIDLVEALENRGASVVGPVAGIPEATNAIAGAPYLDGAIVDLNLRGEMSYCVVELLQQKKIPFVLTSGYSRSELPDRFAALPLVVKPYEPGIVVDRLRSLMGAGVSSGP